MAWVEAALEELGLAPVWVRRDRAATAPAGEDATASESAAVARDAGQAGGRTSGAGAALDVAEPVVRAGDEKSAGVEERMRAPTTGQRGTPERAPAGGLRRTDPAGAAQAPAAAEPIRPPVAPASGAGSDEPDDMAWFDLEPVFEPALPGEPASAAEPAASPVVALGWDELSARVAECQRCRLCEKRTNTVFGVGDREADWMLIGEAPGENEDKQGEPFVGQAGKLLDNMLNALSLKRGENVYIANVIKCRPPGNRNPEPDEVARCEPYLQRQVALVKPKLIVALGRFAAQTLLKSESSIASLRGRVHQYEGVPVIVTYHPAYLLRSLQDKSKAWADLCLANDTYQRAPDAESARP
ncbi:uracil-DNA glycosylase [Burkholderia alba]|uniref:uracil-DNA glycosylase n=1 Tax=Burkholderia alba TaxID=2683677 RepID=UPI002B057368|nr:uracil-DNA glycosylase [Burkholderia alba]